jgi:hypothetical protein
VQLKARPELVQFADLTPAHFQRCPVWIQCHTTDYDEEWHDETDEETFRPRLGVLPGDPSEGMLLVAATLRLADGTALPGFLTPAFPEERDPVAAMGTIQPQLFLPSGRRESFWDGMFPRSDDARRAFYAELGRTPEQVFPISFLASTDLASGLVSGCIDGFYAQPDPDRPVRVQL